MSTIVQPTPLLLSSGIGMMIIGLLPIVYWRRTHGVAWKVFGIGGIAWLSAILLKVVLDITISPFLVGAVGTTSSLASAAAIGIYVGLRTGIFENGFTFIWARRMQLRNASFDEALAFGLGFAGVEAVALGLNSFLSIMAILTNPGLLDSLSPALQQAYSAQFALGPALIGPPLIERASTLFIHSFAVVLVFLAMRNGKGPFILAVLYSSITDGIIPILNLYISSTTLRGVYLIETPFVALGIIGFFGLRWLWSNSLFEVQKPGRPKPHAR
jgi:uncharacterized membrane protein YhfC